MKLSAESEARWVETMPVLARITVAAPKEQGEYGDFIRTTEWGTLWLKGEHYTLVRPKKS